MAEEFTAKFSVDISDLKKNISEANKQIKLANATFKSETSGMEDWGKNADGLSQKLTQLKSVLGSQKSILSSYQSQLERQQEAYDKNGKIIEQLKAKLIDLANNGVSKSSEEYQKYKDALKSAINEQTKNAKAVDDLNLKILNQKGAINQTESAIKKYETAQKELEASEKSLNTVISKQEAELKDLKSKYADVITAEGKNSDSAKDLAKQITALSTDLKNNKEAMDDAEKEADQLDKSLEKVSDQAEKSHGRFKNLASTLAGALAKGAVVAGTAIASGVTALTSASVSASEYADEMLTLSKVTGMSTDSLQAYNYASELVDVSMETLTGSMRKNIKSMSNASQGSAKYAKAYEQLGIAVTDSNGKLRDSEKVYWETIDALGKVSNETERDALAMQLFGKSAQDLNPLIQAGSEEITKLTKEAENMGAVMSEDSLKGLGEFNDSIQRLKGGATAVKNALGTVLLPQLQELADDGTALLGKFTKGLNSAGGDWNKISKVVGDGISDLADMVFKKMPDIMKVASQIFSGLVKSIAKNLPKIIKDIVGMLDVVIDAVIDGFVDLVSAIAKALPNIIKKISALIQKQAPNLIKGIVTLFRTIANELPKILPEIAKAIPQIVVSIANALAENTGAIVEGAVTMFTGIVKAIPIIVVEILKAIPQIIGGILQGLVDGATALFIGASTIYDEIGEKTYETSQKVIDNNNAIKENIESLGQIEAKLPDYTKLISDYGNTLSDLETQQQEAETAITDIIKNALQSQQGLRDEDIQKIQEYMDTLNTLNQEKMEIYRSVQTAELKKLQLESGTITQETAQQYLTNTQTAYDQANKATEEAYTSRLTYIEQKYKAMGQVGSDAYKDELDEAKRSHDDSLAENKTYYDEALKIVSQKSQEWVSKDAEKWHTMADNSKTASQKSGQAWINSLNDVEGSMRKQADLYSTGLDTLATTGANSFLRFTTQLKTSGSEISDSSKQIVDDMLTTFEKLPTDMQDTGKDVLLGLIQGMENDIPKLENASDMTVGEIVNTIRNGLDIHSPSVVMEGIGQNVIGGLVVGMETGMNKVQILANKIAIKLLTAFNNTTAKLTNQFLVMSNKVKSMLSSLLGNIKTTVINYGAIIGNAVGVIINQVINRVSNGSNQLFNTLMSGIRSIVNAIRNMRYEFELAGQYLADGLRWGFLSMEDYVRSEIVNMVNRIRYSVEDAMKIGSPSKVFKAIGEFMAMGLGIGFVDEMKQVNRNIRNALPMANSMLSDLRTGNSTINNKSLNYTQIINAPKSPSRIDIYRNTRNLLALKGV